jgi:hypothetical protein
MITTIAGHSRDWIDVLQALLTPTVAAAAVVIGCAQWWTARNKYRLDLFDRRWAVYVATREIISAIFTHAMTNSDDNRKFLQGIRGARWLFDERVDIYLRKELWPCVCQLTAANSMLEDNAPKNGKAAAADKKNKIWG